MSYWTENLLPKSVTSQQAVEFAVLLGYQRAGSEKLADGTKSHYLFWFDTQDYRSWDSILLHVSERDPGVRVSTSTKVSRSYYDYKFQNETVKQFKARFGGTSRSPGLRSGYYDPGPPVPPAASGCYLAVQRFDRNVDRLRLYLSHAGTPEPPDNVKAVQKLYPFLKEGDPSTFVANVIIPYIVAMMEDYFKATYIALLKYSDRKVAMMKGARLSGEQLSFVSDGTMTVEQAMAESMSFQNIAAVSRNFKDLDQKLDVAGCLKAPYRRRKRTLYDAMEDLVERRRNLIHKMEIDVALDIDATRAMLDDVLAATARVYRHVTTRHGWRFVTPVGSNVDDRERRPGMTRSRARPSQGAQDEVPADG